MAESSSSTKPANSSDSAIQRILSKIDNAMESKNYYEAYQMYGTIYNRYLRQQIHEEALKLMYDGAMAMFQCGEQVYGSGLAHLYLNVLVKSNKEPSEKIIKNIVTLFESINPGSDERESLITSSVMWSSGGNSRGNPQLHKAYAQIFWKEKNYTKAKVHFLQSQDGTGLAEMLIELHKTQGYTNEVDLFIAQVVLQCLCMKNTDVAIKAFKCYTSQHPSIDRGPPYLLPLLNFIWFLLEAVQRKRIAWFEVLCTHYQISIGRDPTYKQYLAKIGEIFFNSTTPRQRTPGFLGNMLQFLRGISDYDGDNMSENEDEEIERPVRTPRPATMDIEELD